MSKVFKPRPLVLAVHLQDILGQIEDVLSRYEIKSSSQLFDDCLCFKRKGNIEILTYPYTDSLIAIPIRYFIETDIDNDDNSIIRKKGVNLKEILEFTKLLICESAYDWEYACKCSCKENLLDQFPRSWVNEDRLNETIRVYEWWNRYHNEIHDKCLKLIDRIEDETEITGIHLYFLKGYILEKIYEMPGYMPKRYNEFRYNYDRIYSEQITDNRIDELINRGLKLQENLKQIISNALPEKNLFSEVLVEDVVKHIINVYVSYHYDSLGKVLVIKRDTN